MKKLVTLAILITFMMTLLLPSIAAAQYDKELQSAINTSKKLFNISPGYNNFTYNIYKQEEKTVFNLNWSDSQNKLGSVNVSVDSKGNIEGYYLNKPYSGKREQKLPLVSKNEALKIAGNLIKRVNPMNSLKVKYQDDNRPRNINEPNYQLNFIRYENGIPFPDNGINITVDGMTGQVLNYNCNWFENATFPDPAGIMTLQKAETQYTEKVGLKLAYRMSFEDNVQKPYLVYTSVYNDVFLDAQTGEVVSGYNFYGFGYKKETADFAGYSQINNSTKEALQALTPKEQEAVESASNLMDQNKAEEIVRKILNLDSSLRLNNINLYNNWQSNEDFVWAMDFSKEEKKEGMPQYIGYGASLDAKTGELLSFYKNSDNSNGDVKYNEEKALQIAVDYIKANEPDKYKEVERVSWGQPQIRPMETDKPRQYYFNFVRKTNGAYFLDNGISVTVDTVKGLITNYNLSWYKKDLPLTANIKTAAEAHKILFDTVGLQARYIATYPSEVESKILPRPGYGSKPVIKLVFALKPGTFVNIDPVTGKILDYNGKPTEPNTVAYYADISGNYAEKQIKVLLEFGIALSGNLLRPNQNITQKEFLFLLQKSLDPYMTVRLGNTKDDDTLYNSLTQLGIVKDGEKAPNSTISRQEAVKYLIRALNYDKVADIKGIYSLPFKDAKSVDTRLVGYVAIANGLKIVDTKNGYFNPKGKLTRANAFVFLYNFLNVR